jgi:hypothetical protein
MLKYRTTQLKAALHKCKHEFHIVNARISKYKSFYFYIFEKIKNMAMWYNISSTSVWLACVHLFIQFTTKAYVIIPHLFVQCSYVKRHDSIIKMNELYYLCARNKVVQQIVIGRKRKKKNLNCC